MTRLRPTSVRQANAETSPNHLKSENQRMRLTHCSGVGEEQDGIVLRSTKWLPAVTRSKQNSAGLPDSQGPGAKAH